MVQLSFLSRTRKFKTSLEREVVEIDGAYFGANKVHKNGQPRQRDSKCILGLAERKTNNYYFFTFRVRVEKQLSKLSGDKCLPMPN